MNRHHAKTVAASWLRMVPARARSRSGTARAGAPGGAALCAVALIVALLAAIAADLAP